MKTITIFYKDQFCSLDKLTFLQKVELSTIISERLICFEVFMTNNCYQINIKLIIVL